MQIKTTMKHNLIPVIISGIIERRDNKLRLWKKRDSLCTGGGNVKLYSQFKTNIEVFPQIKTRTTIQFINSTSANVSKYKHCVEEPAALAFSQQCYLKQLRDRSHLQLKPLKDEWIKLLYVHLYICILLHTYVQMSTYIHILTMEYYEVTKRKFFHL